jgi:hypothetical protein
MKFGTICGIMGIVAGLTYGASKVLNHGWNAQEIRKPTSHTISYPIGLMGHIECTKYENSFLAKRYGIFTASNSCSFEDLNKDKLVDRIRINGSVMSSFRLKEVLDRKTDFNSNKEIFEEGDTILKDCYEELRKRN